MEVLRCFPAPHHHLDHQHRSFLRRWDWDSSVYEKQIMCPVLVSNTYSKCNTLNKKSVHIMWSFCDMWKVYPNNFHTWFWSPVLLWSCFFIALWRCSFSCDLKRMCYFPFVDMETRSCYTITNLLHTWLTYLFICFQLLVFLLLDLVLLLFDK